MALPEWGVELLLRGLRANRVFTSEEGARERIRERVLRPLAYGPPARLRPSVAVDARREHGWPVYELRPLDAATHGTIVWVHGGGWVNEIARQHWALAAELAASTHARVLVPIYPLVPAGTADEANRVVVALVREALDRGEPVALGGDSAGGQIALSAVQSLRDAGVRLPRTVLLSPALDLTWSNPRIPEVQPSDPWLAVPGGRVLADLWRGELPLGDPRVSPLHGTFDGLGPVTLLTGTRDVLNPDAHVLAERLRESGVELDLHEGAGSFHVYALLPTRNGRAGRAAIIRALRDAVAR